MSTLNDLLMRVLANDPAAADEVERMADRLRDLAERLRKGQNGMQDPGGMLDRVQMNLVGPDGTIKHKVDTGKS